MKKTISREIFESNPWLQSMFKLISRKELFSNFIDRDIKTQYQCLKNEIEELNESIQLKDSDNIIKELSDVIFLLFLNTQKLLEQWIITKEQLNRMFSDHASKIYQRSPQLLYWKKEDHDTEERLRKEWKALPSNK